MTSAERESQEAPLRELLCPLGMLLDRTGKRQLYHNLRVAVLATRMAAVALPEETGLLFFAGLLHDVGLVESDDHMVQFRSTLEQKNVEHVRRHPSVSAELAAPFIPYTAQVYIRDHHEWYDGSGYPAGKRGEEIWIGSQILRIADSLSLLVDRGEDAGSTQIYNYLRRGRGREFGPGLWPMVLDAVVSDSSLLSILVDGQMLVEEARRISRKVPEPTVPAHGGEDDRLRAIGLISDARQPFTREHSVRTVFYADEIARRIGLGVEERELLRRGAHLHDIGMLKVSRALLNSPTLLGHEEMRQIQDHALVTMEFLDTVPALRSLADIAGHHHERWDGHGYPDGLKGEEIPLLSRILSVADAIDAMASLRPYRPPLGKAQILEELERCAAGQFDPHVAAIARQVLLAEEDIPFPVETPLLNQLSIADDDIGSLIRYFGLPKEPSRHLQEARGVLLDQAPRLVQRFYEQILSFPQMGRLVQDDSLRKRLEQIQERYVASLLSDEIGGAYVEQRLSMGKAHSRIGLDELYIAGAYARLLDLLREGMATLPLERREEALAEMTKRILFDLGWSLRNYFHTSYALLEERTARDPLTGLYDRRQLWKMLEESLRDARHGGAPLVLLMIDVDHFKTVNDQQGHLVGDAVLQHVVQVMVGQMRMDDVLARYGGEEFCAILPHTTLSGAVSVAQRYREVVAASPFQGADGPIPVTVSIGVALACLDPLDDPLTLTAKADQALYRAKALGRNRVEMYVGRGTEPEEVADHPNN